MLLIICGENKEENVLEKNAQKILFIHSFFSKEAKIRCYHVVIGFLLHFVLFFFSRIRLFSNFTNTLHRKTKNIGQQRRCKRMWVKNDE